MRDNIDGRAQRRSEGLFTTVQRMTLGLIGLDRTLKGPRTAPRAGGESPEGARAVAGLRCYGFFGHTGAHSFQVGRFVGEPVGSCPAVLDLGTGDVTGELPPWVAPLPAGGNDPDVRPAWARWGACVVCGDAWASAEDKRCAPCAAAGLELDADQDQPAAPPDSVARVRSWESGHQRAREVAVGRLSAAADDAEELAAAMGGDAVMWLHTAASWRLDGPVVTDMLHRVKRSARLAVRLARQARALRESADDVQTAADVPEGLCLQCGEPAQEATGRPICLRCYAKARRA